MEVDEGFAWEISDYINTATEANSSTQPFQGSFRYAKLDVEKMVNRIVDDIHKTLDQNPKLNTDSTKPSAVIDVTHTDECSFDSQGMLHSFAKHHIYPRVARYDCP